MKFYNEIWIGITALIVGVVSCLDIYFVGSTFIHQAFTAYLWRIDWVNFAGLLLPTALVIDVAIVIFGIALSIIIGFATYFLSQYIRLLIKTKLKELK